MIRFRGALVWVVAALLLGCGKEAPAPKEQVVADLSRFPAWVVDPTMEGYIAAVGYAKAQKKGVAAQRRVALLSAKAALSRQIGVFIDSRLFRETVCRDEICRSDIKSYSTHYASRMLENIEIKGEWRDPKTGDLYIQVAAKKGE